MQNKTGAGIAITAVALFAFLSFSAMSADDMHADTVRDVQEHCQNDSLLQQEYCLNQFGY